MTEKHVDLACALVGKPFAWHGRGPEAYDCWGLVRQCLLVAGVKDVPDYRSATEGCINAVVMLDAMAHGWHKAARPEPGLVALFRMDLAVGSHVGYLLTADRFLHTTEETGGAVLERLSSPLWSRRVLGYYRWLPQMGRSRVAYAGGL
jgi:cell wall-associated NlpC family hydrolase